MKFDRLKNIILANNSFLLTTHVNPDGDAIGSEIALYNLLVRLGKNVKIINHSVTPYNLEFLDQPKIIEQFDNSSHLQDILSYDVLIALDFNRADRIVSMKDTFLKSDKLKICIDHHQNPEIFVDEFFIDENASATTEILYNFVNETKIVELTKDIAYPIYAGIMTDTGSFRFDRTTPELHMIISNLLATGINPGEVYSNIFDESKFSKIKLLGKALASLRLIADNTIAYMVLSQNDFNEVEGIESDTDGFVNNCLSIENVRLGLLFIELKDGFKVSFRSKGNIPVNKLAAEFDGGGHVNAAGARFHEQDYKKFIPIVLKKAEEYLNNNK